MGQSTPGPGRAGLVPGGPHRPGEGRDGEAPSDPTQGQGGPARRRGSRVHNPRQGLRRGGGRPRRRGGGRRGGSARPAARPGHLGASVLRGDRGGTGCGGGRSHDRFWPQAQPQAQPGDHGGGGRTPPGPLRADSRVPGPAGGPRPHACAPGDQGRRTADRYRRRSVRGGASRQRPGPQRARGGPLRRPAGAEEHPVVRPPGHPYRHGRGPGAAGVHCRRAPPARSRSHHVRPEGPGD
mmetsp:Transcript_17049/g.48008  ORF Transcript_17049/g.48008 Transcript_17049/m.48008 type:complete len:238 (-) Transcript_17049:5571-6284(-)